jgi:hypothetical protein
VLEIVDAKDQSLPSLGVAEGMCGHVVAADMRLIDDRFHLLSSQLLGVDDLDPVDTFSSINVVEQRSPSGRVRP